MNRSAALSRPVICTIGMIGAIALSPMLAHAGASPARPHVEGAVQAKATIAQADGTPAGSAQIEVSAKGTEIALRLTGLPPGVHALHLHAVGQCSGAAFADAGPHLNPASRQHGAHNPAGPHLGDLPNVTVDASGKADARLPLGATSDAGTLISTLFDTNGTAIVVHAAADDYVTDPSGNSGGRIACGVLARP